MNVLIRDISGDPYLTRGMELSAHTSLKFRFMLTLHHDDGEFKNHNVWKNIPQTSVTRRPYSGVVTPSLKRIDRFYLRSRDDVYYDERYVLPISRSLLERQ